jgi:hypothetical protein
MDIKGRLAAVNPLKANGNPWLWLVGKTFRLWILEKPKEALGVMLRGN